MLPVIVILINADDACVVNLLDILMSCLFVIVMGVNACFICYSNASLLCSWLHLMLADYFHINAFLCFSCCVVGVAHYVHACFYNVISIHLFAGFAYCLWAKLNPILFVISALVYSCNIDSGLLFSFFWCAVLTHVDACFWLPFRFFGLFAGFVYVDACF